ncbi:hypothetical protein LFL96_29230 [Paraburkholderia sp. D15]|uniref:hypothetical protein n=1 Tax=Paraburkholderia sp. D15 TaxID=2880218 RepID=UPI002478F2F2|nr:hypothetical protein [Paraburkholderia sp. D15]WGS52283.1 hypothetical protein LFL96_29230 [Paraburkholderia sp. D15]
MNADSPTWWCADDLVDVDRPRQAFSGAQRVSADQHTAPLSVDDARRRWRDLVSAAHRDLTGCASLLGVDAPPSTDAATLARELELGCDRLASRDATPAQLAVLLRACVLSGLTGRLIRDAYDYANQRVVMGSVLIEYQLICAKLADMAIADDIIEQRLIAALDARECASADAGWRGIPALTARQHVVEIARCAASVLSLYVEIHAGHAFVQRAASAPVLAVAQTLLDGIQTSAS